MNSDEARMWYLVPQTTILYMDGNGGDFPPTFGSSWFGNEPSSNSKKPFGSGIPFQKKKLCKLDIIRFKNLVQKNVKKIWEPRPIVFFVIKDGWHLWRFAIFNWNPVNQQIPTDQQNTVGGPIQGGPRIQLYIEWNNSYK